MFPAIFVPITGQQVSNRVSNKKKLHYRKGLNVLFRRISLKKVYPLEHKVELVIRE